MRAEVMTLPGSNSGIYIHTHYQETGFPETGYECQVINSNTNNQPGKYVERKMTASIYAIRNVWKAPARDNQWFHYSVIVQGKTIKTFINEELMAEYTESANPYRPNDKKGRLLSSGTFALQGHDAGSVVAFRNIEVRPLTDDLPTPGTPTDDPEFDAKIIQLSNDNFPLLDLDVRLGPTLPLDRALANSRKFGYTCGFVFDERVPGGFRQPPQAFVGLRVKAPETAGFVPKSVYSLFDYVISDLMPQFSPGAPVPEPEQFMEALTGRIEAVARSKRIHVWSRPTYLPEAVKGDHAALWTQDRIDRVIKACVDGNVALEINDRLKVPGAEFIRRAKAAGARFTFGSDNSSANDLGKLTYCIEMIKECGLTANDIWMP
jgi:hypothetical protein